MGRDGQIVVDDLEGDEIDDGLDDDEEDDGDDGDGGEGEDELAKLRRENAALQASKNRLEAAAKRNNAENRKRRAVAAAMTKHGIEDLDAWIEQQKAGGPAPQPPEGAGEGSGSAAEPSEGQGTGVTPPMTYDDAEVARRVALELEKREAQEDGRAEVLEEKLRASAINSALKDAQFSGTLEKALRVLDLEAIEVDDEANVTGVEEAVEALKKEIPEWFRPARPAPTPRGPRDGRGVDGGEKPRTPPRPQTWAERISGQIAGR